LDQPHCEFFGKLTPWRRRLAMKRKCFSVEQRVALLKQAEPGMLVAENLRQVGISEQTF
jgi:putative transposase